MSYACDGGDYGPLCEACVLPDMGGVESGRGNGFRRELSTHGATSLKYLVEISANAGHDALTLRSAHSCHAPHPATVLNVKSRRPVRALSQENLSCNTTWRDESTRD